MSYFSHNPEAYDEIERKGVARFLMEVSCVDAVPGEEPEMLLYAVVDNLAAHKIDSPEHKAWLLLCDAAHKEIDAETHNYFDRMRP